MAGRKIRDTADARSCLTAADSSGASRGVWARRHGIDGRSLNAWGLNLRRRAERSRSERVRLIELVPTPTPPAASYVIRHHDLAVEVDERFDSETLRRLLAVIVGC